MQMFPVIVVADPVEAAAWYTERLGFSVVVSLGWYEHLRHDSGTQLAFMSPGLEHQPIPLRSPVGTDGLVLSFELESLDAEWEKWGRLEEVVVSLKREEWGQYHFMVKSPGAVLVDIIDSSENGA